MNYGFLIRNDRCIGCHACSTASKSENEVPLGVNRTWVKSVETGLYPNVRRHFQVTRCNHCSNPPCVRICPVTAMYQRQDGIVEFDPDVCIGCKACLQACPYDAIYIDPSSGTAAKCHYCAHRVELELEPACVVVCPEHAIIAGDLDDSESEIARMLAENQVTVRKPEQGTAPKLYYTNGNDVNLTPTAVERAPTSFAWADVIALHSGDGHSEASGNVKPRESTRTSASGAALRTGQSQGVPDAGPILIGDGRMAEQMVQVTYNAQHKIPWHWPVPAYLVTKGISTGLFLFLALGWGLGLIGFHQPLFLIAGFVSILFAIITTGLLVLDLERPERFLRIVFRPQWRSWLTRGAFLLIGFSMLVTAWWVIEMGPVLDLWSDSVPIGLRGPFMWIGVPLALGAALYTAFLFGQAEGRDLWQSALLPAHLVIQAVMAGAAVILILGAFVAFMSDAFQLAKVSFAIALIFDLIVIVAGEFGMPHASEAAARAAHEITHGRFRMSYRLGVLIAGHLVPLGLLLIGGSVVLALAGALSIVGLYLYEYAFVMAPQEVPNS
jgi:Fe-S-cluster-containing dehydrogenase component/formate-dependent nitrite reductase membrane component NrfD